MKVPNFTSMAFKTEGSHSIIASHAETAMLVEMLRFQVNVRSDPSIGGSTTFATGSIHMPFDIECTRFSLAEALKSIKANTRMITAFFFNFLPFLLSYYVLQLQCVT